MRHVRGGYGQLELGFDTGSSTLLVVDARVRNIGLGEQESNRSGNSSSSSNTKKKDERPLDIALGS